MTIIYHDYYYHIIVVVVTIDVGIVIVIGIHCIYLYDYYCVLLSIFGIVYIIAIIVSSSSQ